MLSKDADPVACVNITLPSQNKHSHQSLEFCACDSLQSTNVPVWPHYSMCGHIIQCVEAKRMLQDNNVEDKVIGPLKNTSRLLVQ